MIQPRSYVLYPRPNCAYGKEPTRLGLARTVDPCATQRPASYLCYTLPAYLLMLYIKWRARNKCRIVFFIIHCYNGGMVQAQGTITITQVGLEALRNADTEMSSLETRVLVVVLKRARPILEIVLEVRKQHEQYRFIDPKFVASAAAALTDRGYVSYLDANPPPAEPVSRKRNKRGRK